MSYKAARAIIGAVSLMIAAPVLTTQAHAIVPTSTSAVNTDTANLALRGYDPVAYFSAGKPTLGDARYSAKFNGATYHFASAANLKMFKASPAAYNLHAAVLRARPDINAAVHTHSPANLAVSAQQHGLLPLTQQAMRFYNRIARYPNLTDDTTREGADQLAVALGEHWTMLLENHGALVCGTTLPEAYIYHHFFELACRAQLGALAGGGCLAVI